MSQFVHLHVHSQYSILDALSPVDDLAKTAAKMGMPAVALTDHGNMYGAVEFYKACKGANVKPIIGCEFYVAPESRHDKKKAAPGKRNSYHLTLLAKNKQGYHNLCKLTSQGFIEGFYFHPRIDHELLEKHSEGLICLSGCLSSRLAAEVLDGDPLTIEWYRNLFGDDFYLEMQRHTSTEESILADGMYEEHWLKQQYDEFIDKQKRYNDRLITLSKEQGIPLVATNDAHFIDRADWRAHEVLLNIQSGEPCEIWEYDSLGNPKFRKPNPKRRTYPSHEVYFKSAEQMAELFHDLPEALTATLEIAEKCKVEIDFETKHYPTYTPPAIQGKEVSKEERAKEVEEYLWELCRKGIPKRYTTERLQKVAEKYPGKDPLQVVNERLAYEMSVIVPKGMADYLLIVWDFIHWAKNQGIPMGPGRGSGVGSIVLYLIGITDIEPLRFNLFFERFINPERASYPDIDVDICMDRRNEVIQYTLNKYGKDNVAQIITFGTMKAKMVIRDVGRTLSVPLSKVNAIAKLVPDDLNITLEKALEKDPELRSLYDTDEEARRIIDVGNKLEGSIRSTGIHAAGLIIAGEPLTEYIPLCVAKDSDMAVTQFSMKPVEMVGMLKIDFLGLKNLTTIQMCVDAIKKRTGESIDWVNLPLEDKKTFDLLNKGATLGVFQLESGGMQDLARNLHLDRFEEIIAVGAIYRPGPMEMIPSFINRKHGREEIESDHPWMKDILAETYGIMVYQEQVMQIATRLAKYTLGEGDILRKAMGKKDHKQMAKERDKFRNGALENGIDETLSMKIFDKVEKFASYAFNKSHAAAYGYLSYVTAYMKANYPSEWMAALLTCTQDDITKVAKFVRESFTMHIPVLSPDVNESGVSFSATPTGIRYALSGIKGVGSSVAEAIVEERERNGTYKSLYDFIQRADPRRVGKKDIESLVDAGAFDFTGWDRDPLRESVEPMFDTASKEKSEKSKGFISLFDLMGPTEESRFQSPPEPVVKTSRWERQFKEKELLGFFLSGHPLDSYKMAIKRLSSVPLSKLMDLQDQSIVRTVFLVESVGIRFSAKTQKKFAILTISDGVETLELPIWPELFEERHALLMDNQLLCAVVQVDRRDGEFRLQCRWFDDLTKADEAMIQACDQAYDQAHNQLKRMAFAKQKAAEKPKDQPQEKYDPKPQEKQGAKKVDMKENMPVSITIDAQKCRHSHILSLKKIFSEHRGKLPVKIRFFQDAENVADVLINPPWGVDRSQTLFSHLKGISSVIDSE
jgi:DNA polymerase-3 subunit alpha